VTAKIDETQHYDASPVEVFAMLSDPEFIDKKCLASGSMEASSQALEEDGVITLVSRRVLPAKLPSFAKRFVGETVTLTETQTWTPADSDGARTASFIVDFGNNPIAFHGDIALAAAGEGTAVTYRGNIKASVPLVGGKIEGIAAEWITKYATKEQQVGNEWLAG